LSYQIDVWGRVRRTVEVYRDQAQASAADLAAVNLSMHAQLALYYFQARVLEAATELTWKQAVIAVGLENGLVDETGRPLTRRSRRLLDKAKRRHAPARRNYLQMRKDDRDFQTRYGIHTNSESSVRE
jgi:hypothetical protein